MLINLTDYDSGNKTTFVSPSSIIAMDRLKENRLGIKGPVFPARTRVVISNDVVFLVREMPAEILEAIAQAEKSAAIPHIVDPTLPAENNS